MTNETEQANSNERIQQHGQRLGRLPLKNTMRALQFADFFKFVELPRKQTYWRTKKALPLRTFGNDRYGDCTRAKQAYAAIRMERIELRKTIDITDEEVIRVYTEMSNRRYGGGDNGAYEDDALADWRNPEYTFRDTEGHPLTIDAFLRINALNYSEVLAGLALSGAKGIAVCFNLPWAANGMDEWFVPEGQALTGSWQPGSWGGHSMWMLADYDSVSGWHLLDDTWAHGPRRVHRSFMAAYMDEAHLVIDSVDAWRQKAKVEGKAKIRKALGDVVDAVNAVSNITISI